MFSGKRFFTSWLFIVIVVGCTLRCYHLFEIPYTYDELSALSRTVFNSFHELIEKGVIGDGHPAGVQVFLFYWVKLFGKAEWLVKLPFIILGVLCIPLIYRVGSKWFGQMQGLIAAVFMAMLQYPVMYSQIARPYISGLFLILLLANVWINVVQQISYANLFAYAFILAACAYNHYFSLLTGACITVTGFFVINKGSFLKYAAAIILSIILFLPHLHIFFSQLGLKGLEWLTAPDTSFIYKYLYYAFNFSPLVLVILIMLVIEGLIFRPASFNSFNRYRIISFFWFVVPFAIGYAYSVYRAPVLQYSVLIFSFPFLLLFLTSFFNIGKFPNAQIGLIILVLYFSLVFEKRYYKLFYNQPTETFARYIFKYQMADTSAIAVAQTNPKYLDFYKTKYRHDFQYKTFEQIGNNDEWRKWLGQQKASKIILCSPPVEWGAQYLSIAKEYFPNLRDNYSGFNTDVYVLDKDSLHCSNWPLPSFQTQFGDLMPGWTSKTSLSTPPPGNGYNICSDSNKFVLFDTVVAKIITDKKTRIDIAMQVAEFGKTHSSSVCLAFLDSNDSIVQFRESSLTPLSWDTTSGIAYLTARMYHTPFTSIKKMRVFIKKEEHCIQVQSLKISIGPDNQDLYSLIE